MSAHYQNTVSCVGECSQSVATKETYQRVLPEEQWVGLSLVTSCGQIDDYIIRGNDKECSLVDSKNITVV